MVRCWKKLALGSKNEWVDLIRRFDSGRSPHEWYLLKSKKYKKGGTDFTFLEITFLDPEANFFQQRTILFKLRVNTTYTTFN